jgi:hypothetical protein
MTKETYSLEEAARLAIALGATKLRRSENWGRDYFFTDERNEDPHARRMVLSWEKEDKSLTFHNLFYNIHHKSQEIPIQELLENKHD